MREPVLVIHGVQTRDKREFLKRVRNMNNHLGKQWRLIPVYWGDLGVQKVDLTKVLPKVPERTLIEMYLEGILESLFGDEKEANTLGAQYLYGKVASLRKRWTESIAFFLGDVMLYQNDYCRRQIHKRIKEELDMLQGDYGKRGKPISVLAHSLGGVISFSMATTCRPRLWIKNFVTFGTQPSFFFAAGLYRSMVEYDSSKKYFLPSSIQSWTNLIEPFDPLAFTIEDVFLLQEDEPEDILVWSGEPLNATHTFYWTNKEILQHIATALEK